MLKIAVFQNWGMGDLVMTVPAIHEIRRAHPSAEVCLIVRGKPQAALMAGSPEISSILQLPSNAERGHVLRFFLKLRKQKFDAVYLATRITPGAAALFRFVAGVRIIIGDAKKHSWLYTVCNTIDDRTHRVDRMIQTVSLWTGLAPAPARFELPISADGQVKGRQILGDAGLAGQPFIAIHSGGSQGIGMLKRIPLPLLKNIIAWVRTHSPAVRIVLLFGPDDVDLLEAFNAAPDGVTIVSGVTLDVTKFILSRASGFLGADSGLGHIAASFGIPTITAAGPTNPTETRPYGPGARVVQSPEDLSCRPCWFTELWGRCPYAVRCMSEISVGEVSSGLVQFAVGPRATQLTLAHAQAAHSSDY
jgi:heptosyltransferase II